MLSKNKSIRIFVFIAIIFHLVGTDVFSQTKTKRSSKKQKSQKNRRITKSKAPVKWETRLNTTLYSKDNFSVVINELDKNYPMMALVSAHQALATVEDIDLAKVAFKQIIKTVDKGFPFSLMDVFNVGNLRLNDYDYYSQSYNFYKAILSKNKNMKEWSEGFFDLIDKTNLNRYKYYEALNFIKEKKFDDAKEMLRELLKTDYAKEYFAFVKKISRTLARVHFSLKEYDAAKEIYQDFLLKVNPVTYKDWVELAWVQYYQKDYSSALGSLVNLTGSKETLVGLESFIIKASIYKQLCDDKSVQKLSESFNQRYRDLIEQVQYGKLIKQNELFVNLLGSVSDEYAMINFLENAIKKEFERLKNDTKITNRKFVQTLFDAEVKRLDHMKTFYFEKYKNKAIAKVIDTSESLHFLSYSAAREKYNPKYVFSKQKNKLNFFNFNKNKNLFILWRHNGSFFKEERLNYQVELFDQCDHY